MILLYLYQICSVSSALEQKSYNAVCKYNIFVDDII